MSKTIIIPSNPVDQQAVLDCIKEIDASLYRISGEKDLIKAAVEGLMEKVDGLDKKNINKMARVYHKQNFNTFEAENEDFVELYTTIIK